MAAEDCSFRKRYMPTEKGGERGEDDTYEPSRSLRSSNEKLLKIPKRNLKSFGQRSFSFMAPSLWNSLPATLRNVPTLSQFKSQLKTFLFAQAFL